MSGECSCSRRAAVASLAGAGIALLGGIGAFAQSDPKSMRPQPNDVLVYADGRKANKPIKASDLVVGSSQVLAWAMDPSSKTVRNGSKLNQILVLAVDPQKMADDTKSNAAGKVVAYSAVCTHQGCLVEGYQKADHLLLCPCHQSVYDPSDGAKVTAGPAPNRLASLPLKAGSGGKITVAGTFDGHVGIAPSS
ncbi:MAG: Rieske (2Fe-2S) protein [Vulcanimicrobiaceae bacterium]